MHDHVSNRIREFEELCHRQSIPVTVQRRAVYEALIGVTTHPSADEVYELVKDLLPGISRTTVYRVLDRLVRMGVVNRLPHPDCACRFDGNTQRHHHLVCRECGGVIDVFDRKYDALPLPGGRTSGFRAEDYSVVFTGTCADCRSKN